MKNCRALALIAMTSVVPLAAAACGSAGGTTGTDRKTIAFVTPAVSDPYWKQARCAAQASAKELGFKLDFEGPQNFDGAAELQAFNAVVQKRPAGIVVVPVDPNSFIAPVRDAINQKIPVVTQDGKLNDPIDHQNVRTDGEKAGAMAADKLGALMGGKGTVLVQGTISSVPTLAVRVSGFLKELAAKYPGIHALPTQYSDGVVSKSAAAAENMVRAHPEVTGIYSVTSFEVPPTVSGLKSAGHLKGMKWVAWDATEAEVGYLKDGTIDALVAQDPTAQTRTALKTALDLATGKAEPKSVPKTVFVPATLITKDHLEDPNVQKLYRVSC
jgi:ribose transport system substrate-binding protein